MAGIFKSGGLIRSLVEALPAKRKVRRKSGGKLKVGELVGGFASKAKTPTGGIIKRQSLLLDRIGKKERDKLGTIR